MTDNGHKTLNKTLAVTTSPEPAAVSPEKETRRARLAGRAKRTLAWRKRWSDRAKRAIAKKLFREKRLRVLMIVTGVLLLLALVGAVAYNYNAPRHDPQQDVAIGKIQEQLKSDHTPVFPIDSAQSEAYDAAFACLNYSDQFPSPKINALKVACGWNGSGVATPAGLHYDPNPALRQPLTQNGYSAVPLQAQINGQWLNYYVPVHQTDPATATVVGIGTFANYQPTFVFAGCTADESQDPSSPIVQAASQVVSGASRFTVPGLNLAFNGNGLTAASVRKVTVCAGSDTERQTIVNIRQNGPTADAAFTSSFVLDMIRDTDGEWRAQAIGLDSTFQPDLSEV